MMAKSRYVHRFVCGWTAFKVMNTLVVGPAPWHAPLSLQRLHAHITIIHSLCAYVARILPAGGARRQLPLFFRHCVDSCSCCYLFSKLILAADSLRVQLQCRGTVDSQTCGRSLRRRCSRQRESGFGSVLELLETAQSKGLTRAVRSTRHRIGATRPPRTRVEQS